MRLKAVVGVVESLARLELRSEDVLVNGVHRGRVRHAVAVLELLGDIDPTARGAPCPVRCGTI